MGRQPSPSLADCFWGATDGPPIDCNRPGAVIQIQIRDHGRQIDIGRPIGIDCSGIAPIAGLVGAGPNTGAAELMGHRAAVLHDVGNDILAEIMG